MSTSSSRLGRLSVKRATHRTTALFAQVQMLCFLSLARSVINVVVVVDLIIYDEIESFDICTTGPDVRTHKQQLSSLVYQTMTALIDNSFQGEEFYLCNRIIRRSRDRETRRSQVRPFHKSHFLFRRNNSAPWPCPDQPTCGCSSS